MQHPTTDQLAAVALFTDIDDDVRGVLAARFEVEEFEAGRQVVRERHAGYAFYVIESGSALVSQEGRPIRTLGPGEFFGETAILGDGRRTATVTAEQHLVVWALFGTTFRLLQVQDSHVAEVLQEAARRYLAAA